MFSKSLIRDRPSNTKRARSETAFGVQAENRAPCSTNTRSCETKRSAAPCGSRLHTGQLLMGAHRFVEHVEPPECRGLCRLVFLPPTLAEEHGPLSFHQDLLLRRERVVHGEEVLGHTGPDPRAIDD